jgi:hypothetical protein
MIDTDTREAELKAMSWEDVVAGTAAGRERVRTAIAAFDDVNQVAETWFAEETFTHYDEHTEHIAAFVDAPTS